MAKQKVAKEAKAVQPKYYAVAEETDHCLPRARYFPDFPQRQRFSAGAGFACILRWSAFPQRQAENEDDG